MGADEIAEMAKKRLRLKIRDLTEALEGHQMNDHHRFLIQQRIDHIVLLDRQLEELETRDKTIWEAVSTAADDSGYQDDDCERQSRRKSERI